MTRKPLYVTKCIECEQNYTVSLPLTEIPVDVYLHGFCSDHCIGEYSYRHKIHPKTICRKKIGVLKQKGHHELADWIARGGLEELMEMGEHDDEDND